MTGLTPIARLLAEQPLPDATGGKEDRGCLVAVAGSEECPGAAILTAVAALRSGAGRVQLVVPSATVTAIAVAVPEALVVPWDAGEPLPAPVAKLLGRADAVCVGPGLDAEGDGAALAVAEVLGADTPMLLDARALPATPDVLRRGRRAVVMPNVSEAHELVGCGHDGSSGGAGEVDAVDKADEVEALAHELARQLRTTVAVRGATTVVACAEGAWVEEGAPGLGTPGSGDVLAGIAGGLLARGLREEAVLGWAVAAHAAAGRALAAGRANPGYLARELLDVLPEAIDSLS